MNQPPKPGTVYGKGGFDVREPRKGPIAGISPVVLVLVVVAVVIVVVAVVSVIAVSPSDDKKAAAATSSPAATTSSAPATESSTVASAPTFKAGKWFLSPAGDPTTFLTADEEYAAFSDQEKIVITAEPGLADDSCWSFHTDDDKYLRHFDYRLRFDESDDSDLFGKDATFCPEDGAAAGTLRLRSKNYPDYLLHRRDEKLYIDEALDTDSFLADSTFTYQAAS